MNNLLDNLSAVRICRGWGCDVTSSAVHGFDRDLVMSSYLLLGVVELRIIVGVSSTRKDSAVALLQNVVLRVSHVAIGVLALGIKLLG